MKGKANLARSGKVHRKPKKPLWTSDTRAERRHPTAQSDNEIRSPFARDRDRIIYSSYFRRLALITQVISPDEGFQFHNRMTHVLKVAQVGRRLAERLLKNAPDQAEKLGGLDPDVVEAACLGHDLGHPPFGHITEEVLDEPPGKLKTTNGFEGNPQSFRVITRLERRYRDIVGLNLTRATLNAFLKYPWRRGDSGKEHRKWGAYADDVEDFDWARKGLPTNKKTLEAEIMDWADDISYALHDMEDFYRGGQIPLERLRDAEDRERADFLAGVGQRMAKRGSKFEKDRWEQRAGALFSAIPVTRKYDRSDEHQKGLATFASNILCKSFESTTLGPKGLSIGPEAKLDIEILKELTWHYVIEASGLASQQIGQKKVIETLFIAFADNATSNDNYRLFPPRYQDQLRKSANEDDKIRVVVDLIASMTEQQAMLMHQRLTGVSPGKVFGLDL